MKKVLKKHMFFWGLTLGIWVLMRSFRISCLFRYVTGISCPTCGMTRAIIALIKGDFELYCSCQPMALPMVLAVVLCIHLSLLKGKVKRISIAFIFLVLFLNTLMYIRMWLIL